MSLVYSKRHIFDAPRDSLWAEILTISEEKKMLIDPVHHPSAANTVRLIGAVIGIILAVALAGGLQAFAAGSLDPSFGSGGAVVIPLAAEQRDFGKWIAVQPDGKTVIAAELGDFSLDTNTVILIRLNLNGTLDNTFGSGGKASTSQIHARGIAIQPDGKILVAGPTMRSGIQYDFAVARYNSDGDRDASFGTNGVAANGIGEPQSLALEPDGRIIVIGAYFIVRNGSDYQLARFNSNGSPDLSFGDGGIVRTSFTTGLQSSDQALSGTLQPDGKIVATGFATCISPASIRYNDSGSVDTLFGLNGTVLTPSFGATASRIVVQQDGRIIVAGGNFVAGRYEANGTPDNTWGDQGIARGAISYPSAIMYDMGLEPDGKLVMAGSVNLGGSNNPGQRAFFLERLNRTGKPDPTFGNNGVVITDFTNGLDEAFGMSIDATRLTATLAGYADEVNGTYVDVAAARYILATPGTRGNAASRTH